MKLRRVLDGLLELCPDLPREPNTEKLLIRPTLEVYVKQIEFLLQRLHRDRYE